MRRTGGKRTAVIGLGLIGGSIALAFRAPGYDRDAKIRRAARKRGIEVADSLAQVAKDAELVFVAVSTAETPRLLREVAIAAPNALLTDTASWKLPVLAARLPRGARYVASHPMAGSATPGLDGARADLFVGQPWLIVPTARSDATSVRMLSRQVRRVGAVPVLVDPERHDALMTWVSHLPLAVASALVRAVVEGAGPGAARFAGPGLLDTTRLAATPLPLALELSLADPESLASAVEKVREELRQLEDGLLRDDAESVRSFFDAAARACRAIARPGRARALRKS